MSMDQWAMWSFCVLFMLMFTAKAVRDIVQRKTAPTGSVWSVAWRWADSETDKVELFRTHKEALQMVGRLAVEGYSLSSNKELRVFAYITIKELKL